MKLGIVSKFFSSIHFLFNSFLSFVMSFNLLLKYRELNIRVERKRDPATGEYFEKIGGMMFKDGFLHKTVSLKSLTTQNVQPTFDELEKFRQSVETGDGDMSGLSTLFANRKRGHFMKGDRVIVVKGDLRNLKGCVEKVEESIVHIKTNGKGLPVSKFNVYFCLP